MRATLFVALLATAGAVAGCTSAEPEANQITGTEDAVVADAEMPMRTAIAQLRDADGREVGTATASEQPGGAIRLTVNAMNMPAGERGAHVHRVGQCQTPSFESAGEHWNPTERQHGTQNPQGPHAGDAPNLTIADNGTGTLTTELPAGTFDELIDGDGSAFVVHEGPDDYRTDPTGNSGGRIACGVFAVS